MGLIETYQEFIGFFPDYFGNFLNLIILILLIAVYSFFVWKFYKSISKKDIINLGLNKYNNASNPLSTRLLAGLFYFLEYIIILPIIIFIAYFIFTFFLLILTQDQNTSKILIISAVVIASVRLMAYYKEDLAQDLGKLLPFTLLAVAILNPEALSQTQYFETIIINLSQIPNFFGEVISYLLFIIILEIILRFFDFIFSLFGLEEEISS